jgi:hypothetical protein
MMNALLRRDRWRYSLLIALAILGLEIDVFSNPFCPEFVFLRVFSVLGESSAGLVCPRDVAEPAGTQSAAITVGSSSDLTIDDTVAILSQKPDKHLSDASSFAHEYVRVNTSVPPLANARGDSPANFSPPAGLVPSQLCCFLC